MPFLKEINKDFYFENNQLKLSKEYIEEYIKHPRKITGGKVFSLLGKDKWKTPFMTWCEMTGIYKEKSDDFVVNAGIVIEDKIFNFVRDKFQLNWEAYNAEDRGFDEFSGAIEGFDKNDIFGGLLDGVPLDEQTPILEIKTCAINKWVWKKDKSRGDGLFVQKDEQGAPIIKQEKGGYSKFYPNGLAAGIEIPAAYQYQLGLYCYLKHNPNGLFAVAYLTDKDYLKPDEFVPNDKTIKFKGFKSDPVVYEKNVIKPLTKWYNDFIRTGVSPKMTDYDRRWLIDKIGLYEFNKLKLGTKSI